MKVGAVVALNALGDVFDYRTGKQIAGLLSEDRKELRNTRDFMIRNEVVRDNKFVSNTTLGVVIINAHFNKTQLYSLSVGNHNADIDLVGTLAADVLSEAVIRAVECSEGAYGFPCAKDIRRKR